MISMAGSFLLVATVGALQPDGDDEAGFALGNHAIVADSSSLLMRMGAANYCAKFGSNGLEVKGDVTTTEGVSFTGMNTEVTELKEEVTNGNLVALLEFAWLLVHLFVAWHLVHTYFHHSSHCLLLN